MRTLQNRWYNFLVDTLSLDRSVFQIWLPAAPIVATDAGLRDCQNVIPPASLTFDRATTQVARLSDQYAAIAGQMESPMATLAQAIGGPAAQAWSAYLATHRSRPADAALPALFQNWAARHAIGATAAGWRFCHAPFCPGRRSPGIRTDRPLLPPTPTRSIFSAAMLTCST